MRTSSFEFSIAGLVILSFFIIAPVANSAPLSTISPVVTTQSAKEKKRYIISLAGDTSPDDFCARRGFKMRKQLRSSPNGFARNLAEDEALILPALNLVVCSMNGDGARAARGERGVLAVEEDGPVAFLDQFLNQANPPGLVRLGIEHFPVARINGTQKQLDVGVAVLDSGINPHPDLSVYQFYSPLYDSGDNVGHGTAVAGVIAATDNQSGIVGVAPGVRLWDIKVADSFSNFGWTGVLGGLAYVLENSNQVSVVNLSLGNTGNNAPIGALKASLNRLVSAGIVVVAGAGNFTNDLAGPDGVYGTSDDVVPAALPEAMAVSAMDPATDTMWPASQFSQIERTNGTPIVNSADFETNYVSSTGGAIDVAAPGVNIVTTSASGGYEVATGTSVAAPHVTGLVALYIAANGRATNAAGVWRIRQAIINASVPQSQWHPYGQPFDVLTNNTADPDTHPEPLAIASEDWIPKPAITNGAGAPGNFHFNFNAVPGYDYTVQSTTNLGSAAWTNLTMVSGSNFVTTVLMTDTNAADQNFYRLNRQPTTPITNSGPAIAFDVASRTAIAGSNVFFSAIANGSATLSYHWQKGGVPLADDDRISGSATWRLDLTGAKFADEGGYSVVVTNSYGCATSSVAVLTVQSPLVITGVLAMATSEIASQGRYASNTLNGIYYDGNFWESVGVNQGYGEDRTPAITFDLGTARALDSVSIWNGHEAPVSIKRMEIEVSSNGTDFTSLGEFTLTTISPASETIAVGRGTARYVRFTILENGAGQIFPVVGSPTANSFVAIDEVEFHEFTGD